MSIHKSGIKRVTTNVVQAMKNNDRDKMKELNIL